MGGMIGFINQQAAQQQQAPSVPATTAVAPSVPTTTSDLTETQIPQSAPEITPFSPAPGSTGDLENRAAQAPQQIGQQFQQQRTPQQAPGQFSPDNPYLPIISDYQARAQATAPKEPRSGVKGLLSSFFQGGGSSMMVQAGLTPPDVRHQQILQHLGTMTQMASQWEEMQGLSRYRDAMTNKMQQDSAFESQMQPLRLQGAQQAVTAGQQSLDAIHPALSFEQLKSFGLDDATAKKRAGHLITSADMVALKDYADLTKSQSRVFDYGADGSGAGRGIWQVDQNYNPIKQLSPVSESGRASALQKQQFAQQNAMLKAGSQLVVAYDPEYPNANGIKGGSVVMSQAAAQQRGLQNYKADPSNLNATIAGFNDVQTRVNMLADVANDPARMGSVQASLAAAMLKHGHGIEVGAFGTKVDTSVINEELYKNDVQHANQATRDYVTAMGAAHEAITQLPRLQTFGKSNRMTEKQMEAAQNMLPQAGDDPGMAQQKMIALQTTLDPLRKQLPHMQGAELTPTWSERQGSVQKSIQQAPTQAQPAFSAGQIPSNIQGNYHRVLKGLGLE